MGGLDLQDLSGTTEPRSTLPWSVREKGFAPARSYTQIRKIEGRGGSPSEKMLRNLLYKGRSERDIAWTVPAHVLSKAMQLPTHRERERVFLRERTILYLTGTAHENTWIHNARGGCEVHVLPKAPGSTGKREVLLHGSSIARNITRQYLHTQEELVNDTNVESDEDLERYIRWVPGDVGFDPDHHDSGRADQFPAPEEWSVKTFARYVEDVCAIRLSRGMQRELYQGEETLHSNVAVVLEELFSRPELTPYLSSHAFNLALQYTCKFSELGSTTGLLYNRAKQSALHRQTWIFNIMIERALRMKSMDLLTDLANDMITAGVAPDGMTWSKLLLVSRTQFARQHILDFIFRVYPEEFPIVLAHVAQRLVEVEMVRIVEKQDGLPQFLRRMDLGFGPDWLTTRTLEKILKTCADHQLWQTANEILELAKQREIAMLPSTVKALMYLHYQNGNMRAVIDLLDSPWVLKLGYDSTYAIHWAFLTAWRRRRYNICRVLWQYAATRGLITKQMQRRVISSLVRNQNLSALPEKQSWEDLAGKIVIGTDLDTTNFDTQFPSLTKYFSTTKDPLQWLVQWTPNNGTREEQLSLAHVMMHRDLEAWKVLKPLSRHALPELLQTAFRKDQAWVIERFDQHATLAEMLANAVRVPLTVADEQRSGEHFKPYSSMRLQAEIEGKSAGSSLPSWRPFAGTNVTSNIAMWTAPLSSLSLGRLWPPSTFVRALQRCRRAPALYLFPMWQSLIQYVGLQSNPPALWENTSRAQQTT